MCVCVVLRCLIRTVRRQRRLRSAAGGWRWTWGSLRCGATQSPFAAPPTRRHHRACMAPAPTPALWEVKLQKTNERLSLHVLLSGFYLFIHKKFTFFSRLLNSQMSVNNSSVIYLMQNICFIRWAFPLIRTTSFILYSSYSLGFKTLSQAVCLNYCRIVYESLRSRTSVVCSSQIPAPPLLNDPFPVVNHFLGQPDYPAQGAAGEEREGF